MFFSSNLFGNTNRTHFLLDVFKRLTSTKQLIPSKLPATKQPKLIPTLMTASANVISCGHKQTNDKMLFCLKHHKR